MGALTKMFKPKVIQAPTPQPAAVMPDTDNEAALRARKNAIMSQMRRGGRASTILSDTGADTGSDSYSSKTLG